MSNMNGYEIRHAILNEAREMLFSKWTTDVENERICASVESRAPKNIPAPSLSEIKSAAESMYDFVQRKS